MIEYTNGAPQMVPEELVAGSAERLRVLIADHDGLARYTMRTALHELDRVAIVLSTGESQRRSSFWATTADHRDPRRRTPTQRLHRTDPPDAPDRTQTRILTVSINDQQTAIAALRAGAIGHIHKNVEPDEFARQVVRAADGEAIVPQQLITPLLDLVRENPRSRLATLHSRLTTREWEIVELIGEGADTKHIADHLVLSETTIYSHVKSLMRKLDVHTRREAVTAARHLRREEAARRRTPPPL